MQRNVKEMQMGQDTNQEERREREKKELCPSHLDCVSAGASVPPHSRVSSGAEQSLAPASQSEQSAVVWSQSLSALELPAKIVHIIHKFSKQGLYHSLR